MVRVRDAHRALPVWNRHIFALRHAITASKKDTLVRREQRIFTYLHELEVNEDPRSWLLQLKD